MDTMEKRRKGTGKRWIITIILCVLVIALGLFSRWKNRQLAPIDYKNSLGKTVFEINGTSLTLRDMAFYVTYEEAEVAKQAIAYDEKDPKHYWNTRLNGTYVRVAARNAAIQMAIHDELFYQMAMEEGIELTEEEEASYRLTEQDFWQDMVDAEKDVRLGVTEQDIAETMHKIALAQKYQEIYAALQNGEKDDYNFSEEAYKQLLEKQKYKINEKVWKRVSFGTITLDYQEEN